MIRKGRREKLCFFPGPFFPAHGTLRLTMFFALVLFPAFLAPALASTEPFDESVLAEVQALQELKEKQPEVYQQKILELKGRVKKDVENWRTQKPEVYQRFMQRGQQRGEQHREFLRQKRPDLYSAYQRRHERREKNRETRGATPSQEIPFRPPEPARPVFEGPRLAETPQAPQPSKRQPQPSANRGVVQRRPRMEAGNDPRPGQIKNRPEIRQRQQGAFINSQEQHRKGPSNSQGFSRPNRQQERPRPRNSRQRS
jgi:hypothetical protein